MSGIGAVPGLGGSTLAELARRASSLSLHCDLRKKPGHDSEAGGDFADDRRLAEEDPAQDGVQAVGEVAEADFNVAGNVPN